MKPEEMLENLRQKPYATRVKILWGTVGVVAIVLLAVWIINLRFSLKDLNPSDILKSASTTAQAVDPTTATYAQVERITSTSTAFTIYFNISNPSEDILNFSGMSDIQLTVNNQTYNPNQITDRQGNPFVQKILSNTQDFGILVFAPMGGDNGTLTFNNLSFDNNPSNIFKQDINLNFGKLETNVNLRQ